MGHLGLLRWSDCDAVLRDFRSFSAAFPLGRPIPGAEEETTLTTLIREDPPKHTRVRSLVQQAFTPERVAAMEPHILGVARRMIDQIMARGNQCDFVRDFSLPFPSTVLSELLGIDPSMVETFKRWAESTLGQETAHAIRDEAARHPCPHPSSTGGDAPLHLRSRRLYGCGHRGGGREQDKLSCQ